MNLKTHSDEDLIRLHDELHEAYLTGTHPVAKMIAAHHMVDREFTRRGFEHPIAVPAVVSKGVSDYTFAKAASKPELRYTFSIVYTASDAMDLSKDESGDAHNEIAYSEELQKAQWRYVQSGDRRILLQHGQSEHAHRKAGEWVDLVSWPYETETVLKAADDDKGTNTKIPAGSLWMGVVWEPWAWEKVKAGDIRGFSFGGLAKREVVKL